MNNLADYDGDHEQWFFDNSDCIHASHAHICPNLKNVDVEEEEDEAIFTADEIAKCKKKKGWKKLKCLANIAVDN